MSLEDAINANTKAVIAHNALLEKMLAGAKASDKPAASASAKPAASASAKPAASASASAKPAGKPTATKKTAETSSEHVSQKVVAYLKGGAEDERATRKAQVKSIIDYYGVDRFTAIDPSSYDEALGYLAQFEAGEDPFADDEDGGSEGADDDGMV